MGLLQIRQVASLLLRLVLIMYLSASVSTAQAVLTEAEIKAAFIYNFIKYAQWPANAFDATPEKFNLCLVGPPDAMFDTLMAMTGKSLINRTLMVRVVPRNSDLRICQVLVIAESEAMQFESILRPLAGAPVLTVNGSTSFLAAGGIISLVTEGDRVRFDINLGAARRGNLVLSSKLLQLARRVIQP